MSSHLDEIKSRLKNNGAADAEAIIMDYFSPEKEAGKFAQDAHKLIDGYVPKRRAKNVGQVLSVGDGVLFTSQVWNAANTANCSDLKMRRWVLR